VQGTADWQWHDHELDGALHGGVVALHAGSLALTMPPGADRAAYRVMVCPAVAVRSVVNSSSCRASLPAVSCTAMSRPVRLPNAPYHRQATSAVCTVPVRP
jgi:hypothetical protein